MSDFLWGSFTFLLGLATFLVLYFWVFSFILFESQFYRFAWTRKIPHQKRRKYSVGAMIVGGVLLWAIWTYALPDWWRAATPLVSYE